LVALNKVAVKQQRPRLLVVDDDPSVIDMVTQLLTDSPFHIEAVSDGQQALDAIRAATPDIILLDLFMPYLDGFGVIERLREQPEISDIPIIILTAKSLNDADMETLSDQIYTVIQKQGLEGEALLEQIEQAIAQSNTGSE
jgi:CheY-like chemotaxis protein